MKCTVCNSPALQLATSVECSNIKCRCYSVNMAPEAIKYAFPYHKNFIEADKNCLNKILIYNFWLRETLEEKQIYPPDYKKHGYTAYATMWRAYYFYANVISGELELKKEFVKENPGFECVIGCDKCGSMLKVEKFDSDYLMQLLCQYDYDMFWIDKLQDAFMVCKTCAKKVRSWNL